MAVVFHANANTSGTVTSGGTMIVNAPVNTNGDGLVVGILIAGGGFITTTGISRTGWTQQLIKTNSGGLSGIILAVLTKDTVAASEPGSWVFNAGTLAGAASFTWQAVSMSITGGFQLDGAGNVNGTNSGASVTVTGLTPSGGNTDMLFEYWATDFATGNLTLPTGSGNVTRASNFNGGGAPHGRLSLVTRASVSSATGNQTATTSTSTQVGPIAGAMALVKAPASATFTGANLLQMLMQA